MAIVPKRFLALGLVVAAAVAGQRSDPDPDARLGRAPDPRAGEARAFGPIDPRLSPSADQVAVSYQGAIWRLPRLGGAMTRLTAGDGFDIEPAWSPDGRRIAYLNTPGFFAGRLRVIRAEDGAPVPLPKEVDGAGKLAFDPAGTRLLGRFQVPGRGTI